MTDVSGESIGGYRLGRLIGEGGMGLVWEAEQVSLSRMVALKLIRAQLAADPDFRTRFQKEAQVAASIDHPNVVTVFDSGEVDAKLFISMALIEGPSLRELIDAEGSVKPKRAVAILAQAAAGLDAAHAAGLVHRDVKPSNILLSIKHDRALITDFGIAKARDASKSTNTGVVIGTPLYVAPEQIQGGTVDARSDVYSLGVVFYEMLAGLPPFEKETVVATMWAHLNEAPPQASAVKGVPSSVDQVIAKAMAKDPSERYATPSELARAAGAAITGDGAETLVTAAVIDEHTAQIQHGLASTYVDARGIVPAPARGSTPSNSSDDGEAGRRRKLLLGALAATLVVVAALAFVVVPALGPATDTPQAAPAIATTATVTETSKTPTAAASPPKVSVPTKTVTLQATPSAASTSYKSCDENIRARSGTTTCGFATNAFYVYWETGGQPDLAVWSPSAGKYLPTRCAVDAGTVMCSTDDGGLVEFPEEAVATYSDRLAKIYHDNADLGPG
jgi:serine/threonine-protein kinase